jgi:hypothetical protein
MFKKQEGSINATNHLKTIQNIEDFAHFMLK